MRNAIRTRTDPEPTWDIAYLFPGQGTWSEEDYLALNGNYLVEFTDGYLEVLPMPTMSHQKILAYVYGLLFTFASAGDLGTVLFAPMRVRVGRGKYREPDVLFMRRQHAARMGEDFWKGADLVMEVVSGDKGDRNRDLVKERRDYARARIAEYWLIDPDKGAVVVLRLSGGRYVVHGEFGKGTIARSHLLPGFAVDVDRVLAEGSRPARKKRSGRG